ncbi:MAG TPA: PSD1 and planctomycete cytochrome C domain-containing protein [Verrucomicrobiales bacterium]|nr:PSD1 and planctomycete cytochrome C domain-containing protein [Verrucomicrobiales bacterium]
MRRLPPFLLATAALLLASGPLVAQSPLPSPPPDFSRDVRPILSRYCFKCHGPDEGSRKASLRLDDRTVATAPAKSGAIAIVPGKPADSELIKRTSSHDPDEIMPPPAAKLPISSEQVEILRRWIAAGAEYKEHWAFIAPKRPPVPDVPVDAFKAASTTPIDRFVAARLAAGELPPSPPANAASLIRRVTLDLIGLPPKQDSLDSLLRAANQGAGIFEQYYESYVDSLLASPQYGERWARKWLDLARYADTNGYEKDRARQIWPWRDWVVRSLNADMPFDQFTVEQLAGDMLPGATAQQIIATGFHRNSMLNEEGGIDPLEFRFHAMTDRMAVTGATWLGLTLQCAQCHTHKFDPIQHREYYQMMAFLNNADEPDFAIRPADAARQEQDRAAKVKELIAALPDKWPAETIQWETAKPLHVTAANETPKIMEDGSVLFPAKGPDKTEYVLEIDPGAAEFSHLKLEALTDPSLPSKGPGRTPHGNFVLTEITVTAGETAVITSAQADAEQHQFPVGNAFDENPNTGWAVDIGGKRLNSPKTATFHFAKPLRGKLTVKLGQHYGGAHTMGRVRLSTGVSVAKSSPRDATNRAYAAWLEKERARSVAWTPVKPERAVSNSPLLTVLPDNSILGSGDITKADTYDLTFKTDLTNITAIKLEVLPHESLPGRGPGMAFYEGPKGDFFMGEFQATSGGQPVKFASATDSYTKNGFGSNAGSRQAFDGDPQTGWSTSGAEGKSNEAVFVFEKPLTPVDGALSLKLMFGRHYACSLGHFRIWFTTAPKAVASPVSTEIQSLLSKPDASLTQTEHDSLRTAFLLTTPELASARKEIDALKQPASYQTTLVMRERPSNNPRPTFRRHRGEYTQPEEKVNPGVLSVLPPLPAGVPNNRLSFARWLVSRENPLTARVVVNRQWAAFFGRGLVRTQEDFGYQGDLPTHPALLDWLAIEFMENGWSMKKLHRLIVMSATYRQSSLVKGRGAEVDAENLLLWRGPRHRLEAEQIRDSALAVTGLLSSKMGGPGVFPPQPAGVTTEGTYGPMQWTPATGEDRYRRSLYTFTKRTAPFAMSNTFDAPTGESCVARRDVSNTPLQSLTLLNDVMFMEAAQALAKEVAPQPGTLEEKLRTVIRRILCRLPADDEITALATFFNAQQRRFSSHELDPVKTGGSGADPVRAAWTLTIRALLNTDEFVSKS